MVKVLTCGCCSNGCVCVHHQDTPMGRPPFKCNLHCDQQTFIDRWVDARIAAQDADDQRAG